MAQHSVAPGAGWFVGLSQSPGLICHQASHHHLCLHRSSPNTGAAQSNLSRFSVHTLGGKEGRKNMKGGRNNSAAAVAHPALQWTNRQTHIYNNTNVHAVTHPHSTLIMIHTKPHKHLPTSAQEPQPNTNIEPKHIVESLSLSLWPDFFVWLSLQVLHPSSSFLSSFLHSSMSQFLNFSI